MLGSTVIVPANFQNVPDGYFRQDLSNPSDFTGDEPKRDRQQTAENNPLTDLERELFERIKKLEQHVVALDSQQSSEKAPTAASASAAGASASK